MKDRNIIIAIIIISFSVILLSKSGTMNNNFVDTVDGQWDISKDVENKGYNIYLIEEADFDYSDSTINNLATQIKGMTSTPDEAVKETIKYVVQHVGYSSAITISQCYSETASSVLASGRGDCVSMSRLVTALLRAQGIPARTSGGCLSFATSCVPLFSTIPFAEIQVTDMVEDDFKKRGFLHEWVEVWTPSRGWFLVEATAGQTFPLNCGQYIQYSYDTNQYDRCVITDQSFWSMCSVS